MKAVLVFQLLLAGALLPGAPAGAAWKAASPEVAAAANDPRIVGALSAVTAIDQATLADDHAAFAALLADDLAVNNPQKGVSVRGATAQRNTAGQISYTRYDRIIEYAGLRGDMVVLMGEEIVMPKAQEREVHRRFTDLWKPAGQGWKLTARQATVIDRP